MSPANQPGLTDALQEAPALLAAMSSRDWAAISGCSRQLRQFIHSSAQTITVHTQQDVAAVLKGSWPQLALIKVDQTSWPTNAELVPQSPLHSTFTLQLLASFQVAQHTQCALGQSTHPSAWQVQLAPRALVYVVKPWAVQRQPGQHVAAALAGLRSSGWRPVSNMTGPADLILYSTLDSVTVRQLLTDLPPHPKSLCLKGVYLDEGVMNALTSVDWPLLKSLYVDEDWLLDAAAIATIANAPSCALLAELRRAHVKLDSAGTRSLTLLHDCLHRLSLAFSGMDEAAMTQLFSAPWPQLQHLAVIGNTMTADTVAQLVSVPMPKLIMLRLENKLTAAAIRHLAQGKWPKLKGLALCSNPLHGTAIEYLLKGSWPKLSRLWLEGTHTGNLIFELLPASQWRQLKAITTDSVCGVETRDVLYPYNARPNR